MALEKHVVELTAKDSVSPALQKIGKEATAAGLKAEQGAQKAARATKEWGDAATKAGAVMGTLVGVTSALGQAHVKEDQQLRALERAYGEGAQTIDDYAQKLQQMGIASDDSTRIAALGAQSLAKNYGLTTDEILKLIDRSADLTQTTFDQYGAQLSLTDVMQRVQSAIRGEAESAEVLGVAMSDTRLATLAAEAGLVGWTTTMTDAEKAAFRLSVFLDDTANASGAAAERSGTLAGQVNAVKLQILDYTSVLGGMLGPLGESTAVLGDMALAMPLVGAGAGKAVGAFKSLGDAMKGSALLAAAGPWAALALGVGVAAGAIYYLTTRESESEKQVKALNAATADYTQTIIDQTTALANLSLLDEAEAMKTYLDVINQGGLVAQQRIDTVVQAIEEIPGAGVNLEGLGILFGDLDQAQKDYIVTQLESNGYLNDQVVTAEELSAILPMLARGYELNAGQAAALNNAMIDVTTAMADPDLFGKQMGDQASAILTRMYTDVITVDEAITQLLALPTDQFFNRAAAAALAAVPATDALTESLYGGVAALGDANLHLKSYEEILTDAHAATQAQIKAAIDLAKANSRAGWDKGNAGALAYQEQVIAAAEASKQLSTDLDTLGASLERNAGGAAAAAYERVVGFTSGITASIQTTKDWADALFLPVDGLSIMSDLLARGIIDAEDVTEATTAQVQITDALAESTDAMNEIQIKQASTIADAAMASADYLQNIAGLDEAEQALALAWADTDIAGRANDIAGMASQFDTMNVAQQKAFENMVLSAAATDPELARVLEDLGLIVEDVNDPTGYKLSIDSSESQTSLDTLAGGIGALITVLGVAYDLDVDAILDTSDFWDKYNGLPDSKTIFIYTRDGGIGAALGGMIPYEETAALGRVSGGNMALVGEHGPEIVKLHGGDVVIPNHASRYMDQGKGGGGVNFYGPITVIANNPEQFMQQMRSYSTTMERR